MEHVFTIGINVDDDAICKAAVDAAAKAITKTIEETLLKKDYYNRVSVVGEITKDTVGKWLDDNADRVIDKAVAQLADRLARTKIVKEKLAEGLKIM